MPAEQPTALQLLPIRALQSSPTNPRKLFGHEALQELANSLRTAGVQVPLLVRAVAASDSAHVQFPEHYEVVAGGRRLRAAYIAELTELPCIVREMTDEQVRETQILENLHRLDVHPIEEAEGYRGLMLGPLGALVSTPEDVAKRVGKTTAHVARRLRLLDLELPAKRLFREGHLTAGHAELLARLAPADQLRALDYLLDVDRRYVKSPIDEVIAIRVKHVAPPTARDKVLYTLTEEQVQTAIRDAESVGIRVPANPAEYLDSPEDFPDFEERLKSDYGTDPAWLAKDRGKRVVEATEVQLRHWIGSHVFMQLGKVPWALDDATLVPEAGPCTTCPKRSGANVALFGDLTAAEDVCLDTVCFAAKQTATLRREKKALKEGGGDGPVKYLKLSAKSGNAKLAEVAVDSSEVTTRKTLKLGQWLPAENHSCGGTAVGLMVDGPDKGTLLYACADQGCKLHKHTVARTYSDSDSETPAEKAKREEQEAKAAAWAEAERPIRAAVLSAAFYNVRPGFKFIRALLARSVPHHNAPSIADALAVSYTRVDEGWGTEENAQRALAKAISITSDEQLEGWAWLLRNTDLAHTNPYSWKEPARDRANLWREAKALGVDPDAIAAALAGGTVPGGPRKPAGVRAPAKRAAAAPAAGKPAAKKATAKRPAAKKAAAKRPAAKRATKKGKR